MLDPSSRAFFEEKYRLAPDPWAFASDAYEQERYSTILWALRGRHYERCFEPGCSVGVLTAQLAEVCNRVDAIDISQRAVEEAQRRCQNLGNVHIRQGNLPECIPHVHYDLIVLSDIGYYFPAANLRAYADRLTHLLPINGVFLAAHWLGTSADHLLSGDEVHKVLHSLPGLRPIRSERHPGFRLDSWARI